jgi:hypothetical protein
MSGLIRESSLTPAYSPNKKTGSSKHWSDAGVKQFTSHRNAFQFADIAAYIPETLRREIAETGPLLQGDELQTQRKRL